MKIIRYVYRSVSMGMLVIRRIRSLATDWSTNTHVCFASADNDLPATDRLLFENSRPADN
jgi:hypothetical protein